MLNTNAAAPRIDLFRLIFAVLVVMSVLAALCALLVHRFAMQQPIRLEEEPSGALATAVE